MGILNRQNRRALDGWMEFVDGEYTEGKCKRAYRFL